MKLQMSTKSGRNQHFKYVRYTIISSRAPAIGPMSERLCQEALCSPKVVGDNQGQLAVDSVAKPQPALGHIHLHSSSLCLGGLLSTVVWQAQSVCTVSEVNVH